ncbi:MAG: hypothetical protein KDD11_16525 [Acidobacteria bacterium]|nr:hypothetical protein [Acidobacteriota bacterium]
MPDAAPSQPIPPSPSRPAGTEHWFRRVTFYALLAGLCPLIPIPFLDDKALDWVRRRMLYEQLRGAAGGPPASASVRVLAGSDEGSFLEGCWSGCFVLPLVKLVVYLVRKVFSKILILLTLNQCVERFSETFHLGYLVHHALGRGDLGAAAWQGASTGSRRVREAIRETLDEIDPRPVRQLVSRTLRGSRRLLLGASRVLGRWVRRGPSPESEEAEVERELAADESRLSRLLDRLSRGLGAETGYLETLEATYDAAWAVQAEGGSGAAGSAGPGARS